MVLTIKFQAQDNGLRAVDALRKHYAFSNRRIKKIKFQGYFKLNGQPAYLIVPVQAGDVAELSDVATQTTVQLKAEAADYIVHAAEWFIVANKAPNMLTQPNFWHAEAALSKIISDEKLHLVNRLDKDSSGLVLLATSPHAHSVCTQLAISKYYLTLVYGDVAAENYGSDFVDAKTARTLESQLNAELLPDLTDKALAAPHCNYCAYPICRREASILERRICLTAGKSCLTLFRKLAYDQSSNVSLVLCRLLTGRTHQIRLHFLSMGHPLVGESLYDLANLAEMAQLAYTQRPASFKAEIPESERLRLDQLRFTDNPLPPETYRSYLAKLLNLNEQTLQNLSSTQTDTDIAALIKQSPGYKAMLATNATLPRQALHAWALSFANPANYPHNSESDFYRLFAPLPADMAAFIKQHFPRLESLLLDYQATKLHYPEPRA